MSIFALFSWSTSSSVRYFALHLILLHDTRYSGACSNVAELAVDHTVISGSVGLLAGIAMIRVPWTIWACWSAIVTVASATAVTPSQLPARHAKLLYVMEYDGKFDWEPVQLRTGVTNEALDWLLGLHDRLTVTLERPLGDELMARRCHILIFTCKCCNRV